MSTVTIKQLQQMSDKALDGYLANFDLDMKDCSRELKIKALHRCCGEFIYARKYKTPNPWLKYKVQYNFLQRLKTIVAQAHKINIEPITEYDKQWNKSTNLTCKNAYKIAIEHTDNSYRIMPSALSAIYYKRITKLLQDVYGDKLYTCGYSECGTRIVINVMVRLNKEAA